MSATETKTPCCGPDCCQGERDTAAATVDMTVTAVNDAPDAADDSATTDEDTAKTVNVLGNDSTGPADESGQTLSLDSFTRQVLEPLSLGGSAVIVTGLVDTGRLEQIADAEKTTLRL